MEVSKNYSISPDGEKFIAWSIEQRVRDRGWRSEEENLELRNAKPGTRPKGGSPKDNCEFWV